MNFLRTVAAPLAAGMLVLASASIPALAQPAPASAEDLAYQTSMTAATMDVSDLLVQKAAIDSRLATADANTDYAALVTDLGRLKTRWQAVTDQLVALQPTPRYVSGNFNLAVATQTFAVSYDALATGISATDATGIGRAVAALTAANDMLIAAGTELQAA